MRRVLDLLFGVAIATPTSLLLYVSLEATKFEIVAEPLVVVGWVGIVYGMWKWKNGDA